MAMHHPKYTMCDTQKHNHAQIVSHTLRYNETAKITKKPNASSLITWEVRGVQIFGVT